MGVAYNIRRGFGVGLPVPETSFEKLGPMHRISLDFTDFRKHVKISLVFRIHFSDFGFHAVISRFREDSL